MVHQLRIKKWLTKHFTVNIVNVMFRIFKMLKCVNIGQMVWIILRPLKEDLKKIDRSLISWRGGGQRFGDMSTNMFFLRPPYSSRKKEKNRKSRMISQNFPFFTIHCLIPPLFLDGEVVYVSFISFIRHQPFIRCANKKILRNIQKCFF